MGSHGLPRVPLAHPSTRGPPGIPGETVYSPKGKKRRIPEVRTGKNTIFAHVIGYGREKQCRRLLFFWRSLLPVRVRPLSSQIGPKQTCNGKESTGTRSFSPPCWRTLFLLLLWKYVKGVPPYGVCPRSFLMASRGDCSRLECRHR